MIGQTVSHYRITEKLGEGGMGVVYKALDTKLDRLVAVKFLATHLLRDDEGRKRFQREAKAAAALDHPNICTVHEIDEVDDRTFIVMAFLEGQPLSKKIAEGPLKLIEALAIAIQVAEGLEAAHGRGIVHRDIKPDNIMLLQGSRGLVKLMDFGLAQLAGSSKLTRGGSTLGTVFYMSPEQAQGAPTDHRSDLWALGVVLYEMVSGQTPFQSETDQAVVYSILNVMPEPLTALRTGVPKDLERITDKCLQKDPGDRYQRADDLLVDLRSVKRQLDSDAARQAPLVAGRPSRRQTTRYAAATVLVMASIAGIAFWLGGSGGQVEKSLPDFQISPLTTYPGNESDPTFSPDGTQVAFSWDGPRQDNEDIYIKAIGSEVPLRLTHDPAPDRAPSWSPDGRFIAFLRFEAGQRADVFLTAPVGGSERKLVGTLNNYPALSWAPDSQWLVVSDRSAPADPAALYLLSIVTGEKRTLTAPPRQVMGDFAGTISPDGRNLVFGRQEVLETTDLFLLRLSSSFAPEGEPIQITSLRRRSTSPTWVAGGSRIIFCSGPITGRRSLFAVSATPPGVPEALPFGEAGTAVTMASRGDRLAFDRRTSDSNLWRLSVGKSSDSLLPPERLIASTALDWNADYSPDGKRIVFQSARSGDSEIWVCDSDGSDLAQLTRFGGGLATGTPRWSPDGRRIVFDSRTGGTGDIWSIDAAGGPPQQLTNDPAPDQVPSWSRDGKWIYFASNRGGHWQVWRMPAAGGEAAQVTRQGGFLAKESPDGQWVYYDKGLTESREPGLWKAPAGGGEEMKVLDNVRGFGNFAIASDGIYFLSQSEQNYFQAQSVQAQSLQFFDFKTGTTKTLLTPGKRFHYTIALSPDEHSILYSQFDETFSDLILVENFR